MRDIEKFLENTQKTVSGVVTMKLRPYSFQMVGVESPNDLMKAEFGEYGEMNKAWTSDDVKGFTKILGTSLKVYNSVNKDF
jgi:argininosuccinate synthase